MDELSIVFITLGINMGYQILHYCIRKFSEYTDIDLGCFHFRKANETIKNKRSSESDKDGITEITLK